ncbi:MAG: hypothetical protein GXY41_02090 [Phycisphaerae bacterium]|jgi:hypothetical protein|nr:hypothetical protein [Phycisphaerae bacterium]
MKKTLVVLAVLCGLVPAVQAADVAGTDVGITADLTFMSRYIWHGINKMGSSPVWQPSVDFDLGGGIGANLMASYANNSGHVNETEYAYTLYYGGSILENCFKTDYTLGWRYYDFIDMPSKGVDVQEVFVEMDMPQLLVGGLVPHINYYYVWQARSGRSTTDSLGDPLTVKSGSIVAVGFDYNFSIPEVPEAPMTFSWDIVYNDGAGPMDMKHDWTHMVWGLKAKMQCPLTGGAITPQLYYQNTLVDSVFAPKKDFLYGGISYSLKF